jgi:hypothetical protein
MSIFLGFRVPEAIPWPIFEDRNQKPDLYSEDVLRRNVTTL